MTTLPYNQRCRLGKESIKEHISDLRVDNLNVTSQIKEKVWEMGLPEQPWDLTWFNYIQLFERFWSVTDLSHQFLSRVDLYLGVIALGDTKWPNYLKIFANDDWPNSVQNRTFLVVRYFVKFFSWRWASLPVRPLNVYALDSSCLVLPPWSCRDNNYHSHPSIKVSTFRQELCAVIYRNGCWWRRIDGKDTALLFPANREWSWATM